MASKCNYSYENLIKIFAAAASRMVQNGHLTLDEAKAHLTTSLAVLKICENDKGLARELLAEMQATEKEKK